MVVAEALAHGCPAIVSHGAPWAGLEEKKCGWWIDNSIETLTSTLKKAMQLPSQYLRNMGIRGREWMEKDYSWESVGKKMITAYEWLIQKDNPPKFVKMD